jgi:L-threonylcarbamoyladenylate synthase
MSTVAVVPADIEKAVATLMDGGVIAFPTDTLYALGADARQAAAVDRVFAIKGREAGKALPLFVSGLEMAHEIAEVTPLARRLAIRYWPGALTLVLRKRTGFQSGALAGGTTVALRVPRHDLALDIITKLGRPVTATSANLSGGPDPVDAQTVLSQIGGRIDLVLDGGRCAVGVSSTVVDCTGDAAVVLRRGAISDEEIERAAAEPSQ